MPRTFVRLMNKNEPENPLMSQYRPPEAPPEKSRWHIPEIDYGLLGQFQSQKEKFKELEDINKILSKPRRAYKVRMEDITDEEYERNGNVTEAERVTMTKILNGTYSAQLEPPPPKLSARTRDKMTNQLYERRMVGMSIGGATVGSDAYSKQTVATQTLEAMMSAREKALNSARGDRDHQRQDSARASARGGGGFPLEPIIAGKKHTTKHLPSFPEDRELMDGDLHDQKVSTFKALGKEHPDILAKWRTNRASEFVMTQKHPLEPPTGRDLPEQVFKPAGTVIPQAPKDFKKKPGTMKKSAADSVGGGGGGESTARMRETLDTLVSQLEQTEAEIERQKLKIALRKNTKHYQK